MRCAWELILSGAVLGLALGAVRAAAQQHAAFSASAKVERPLAATQGLDPTAAGTEIDVSQRDAAQESLADVLLEVPGARPYRTGSLGTFTSAALRGADAEHTAVLFGEIPLTAADASAFDLSALPLSLAQRVVVYRGGAPLWLSQGVIGGVLQLIPRSAQQTRLQSSVTAGSFGTYGLTADSAVASGKVKLQALTAVLRSQGDFPVAFDNKTALDPSDDYVMRRKNADFVQGNGLVSVSSALGPGSLSLWMLGYARSGGEPGAPADPFYKARRQQLQAMSGVGYRIERRDAKGRPTLRLSAQGALSLSRNRFADLAGEVGPTGPSLTQNDMLRGYARLAVDARLIAGVRLTGLASLTRDGYSSTDIYAPVAQPDSARTSLAAGGELLLYGKLLGQRFELRPSLRVEHTQAGLHSERFGEVITTPNRRTLATYRLAAALELLHDLSLSASWASGARMPSMLELFGDAALLRGNTALRPERSQSVDVGLSSVICRGPLAGSFELRAFQLTIADQVLFTRNSFSQLMPLNLAHSRVRGLEAGARAQLARFWLNGAATFLDTQGKPGKRLPNRPRATLLAQPGLEWKALGPIDRLRSFVELQYIASSFDDPDNQTLPKPPALFLDAGVSIQVLRERAILRLTVTDVFNRGGRDLRQFPLPGRTIMVSLAYNEE